MEQVWNLRHGDTLRWFARCQPDGVAGGVLTSRRGLDRLLHNLDGRADLYWALNPTRKTHGVRASALDVTHWTRLLIDVDPVEPNAKPLQSAMIYVESAKELLSMDLSPLVIDSGRGVQVVLSLTPLELTDDALRSRARRAAGAFLRAVMARSGSAPLHGCVVDTSCSDLARVARMPGTINLKTRRRAAILAQLVCQSPYASADIHVAHESILAFASETEPSPQPIRAGLKYQHVYHRLTRRAQEFLEGVRAPGRHSSAYACARSLRDQGVSSAEAERTICAAARLCLPPMPWPEARRVVLNAYAAT